MSARRTDRPPLSREAVLRAALRVIDRGGVEACSMRAVAREVGVEAMSLYWHVDGKDAMLDGVLELVLSDLEPPARAGGWRDGLDRFARDFRAACLRHPRVMPLIAMRPAAAYLAAARAAARVVAGLEAAGFDRVQAVRAARVVSRWVLGFSLAESIGSSPGVDALPPDVERQVRDLLSSVREESADELFSFGLDAVLDGLEARLSGSVARRRRATGG